MLRGESVLTFARRIQVASQHARAASSTIRAESQSLHAAARRTRTVSGQLMTRCPYARLVGTRSGKPTHIVIRRDGTVYGEQGRPEDPLTATLAIARGCDQVSSLSFHRVGRRSNVPLVDAAAHLDERQRDQVQDARQLLSDLVRRVFQAGLAATSVLSRATDPHARRTLTQLVADLDSVYVELRSVILQLTPGEPGDPPPSAA